MNRHHFGGDVDSAGLAEFRIIDPPRISPNPVFPNRLALIPLVLLAALGAGLAASFAMARVLADFSRSGSAARIYPAAGAWQRVDAGNERSVFGAGALPMSRLAAGSQVCSSPAASG